MHKGRVGSSNYYRYRAGLSNEKRSKELNISQGRVLLSQLAVALAVFFVVFVGKGSDFQQIEKAREKILETVTYDMNLRQVMDQVQSALSTAEFTENLFFDLIQQKEPEEEIDKTVDGKQNLKIPSFKETNASFLTDSEGNAERYLYINPKLNISDRLQEQVDSMQTDLNVVPAVPAAGTIIAYSDYDGEPVPERYTMDHLSLGDIETVTPVLGHLNSPFGYRVHPISGKKGFHAGVDISGKHGDPIFAFSSGTVDYIGEDGSYGLYTQIDHGNGVKSFYAHCQSLQVKQGQAVSVGECIGTIGSSGNTTGPHLHLEIKWAGKYLDPFYYIEVLES